ncbi:MAG: RNB domain-containing ribonuclease [Acidobacteria bacterium]|nr:RNB domain-containing ribonuclease [Acidobacteriota bacterium]
MGHRDGYGFVIPDEPPPETSGDIFIGADSMGDALHGDRVLVGAIRVRSNGRAEGRIQRVLDRAQKTVVGEFRFGHRSNYVLPFDERIPHQIVIPRGLEIPPAQKGEVSPPPQREELDGAIVNVEITRFPSGLQSGSGRVLEILGRPGEFGVDVEIIIRKYHLPHQFSADALRETKSVPASVPAAAAAGRRDFRDLPIVTIDGETAKDFDDAVAVLPLPNGNFQLQVHIADVAHYVQPGTALDRDARLRGTSVYFPDRAVPMLPEELSNGICSLKPHQDRLTLSVIVELDGDGEVLDVEFCEGIIRSAARMTYTDVNRVLENDLEARKKYASLVAHFERMRELTLKLNEKRRRRGAIDFDLPEPVIQLDELGVMVSITRAERNIAHRIIEEFMLTANEAVAQFLERAGAASLYRIHEKPDPRKVLEFEEVAATFGYSLGIEGLRIKKHAVGRDFRRTRGQQGPQRREKLTVEWPEGAEAISPRHYQRLADRVADKPEERILSYLMLRSLQQARYSEQNSGHFALATPCYTHFTSPIRRYPDLAVHRVLRAILTLAGPDKGRTEKTLATASTARHHKKSDAALREARRESRADHPLLGPMSEAELEAIAIESSETERRAQEAERELVEWKKARFLRDRLGEEFDALIISVTKFGFFVELMELFIEGLVSAETLDDQPYLYQERERQWIGQRTRRRFRIGDRLKVRLDRLGELGGKMSFSVAE